MKSKLDQSSLYARAQHRNVERYFRAVRSFPKTDSFCVVLLCLLAALAYLPTAVLGLSLNPMNFGSGLITSMRRGVTLGGPWLDPNTSFTIQALGGLSAHDWLHGVVPWWNPYTGVGLPLAGEMQTISLFLPFVLLLHFANGLIFLKITLQMVAGVATYALVRQLGLGRLAAFVAATLYEFNGPFAWFGHAPIMPIPFLPILLLGIERAFVRAQKRLRGGWILLGTALAYSLYAGFPETAFLNVLLALVWILYRLAVAHPGTRFAFATKVTMGGLAGLLVAGPILAPFLEFLRFSGLGREFPIEGLPKVGFAALLMPYIYGPIGAFSDADPSGQLGSFWGANGGYLNLTAFFLAILGLFSGKRERGLRIMLAVWVALFLAKVTDVLGVSYIFAFIPLMNVIAVNRYCEASWAMAAAILAAYALDDWRRGEAKQIVSVVASTLASVAVGSVAIWLGSATIHFLFRDLHGKHYPFWLWSSLGWAFGFIAALAGLYCCRPGPRITTLMAGLAATNVFVLYTIPTLAGSRDTRYDFGLVTFLKQNLGLERFYTLGPFAPNYSGYFQIASINHNVAPVPADWVQFIRSSLDSEGAALFVGYAPAPFQDREKALRTHFAGFEAVGVKYVVAPAWSYPFTKTISMPVRSGPDKPLLLQSGTTISGALPKEFTSDGWIRTVGVAIGIYGGPVKGNIKAEICAGESCASGIKSLAEAQDRQNFEIPLDTPLHVNRDDTLRYTLTYGDDSEPASRNYFVFLWLLPSDGTSLHSMSSAGNKQLNYTPEITLTYALLQYQPPLVYRSPGANVFELPHPASYFETRGAPCQISVQTRELARTNCKANAVLIRRELFYPGWRALVNGRESTIARSESIFQVVDLPQGHSVISFSYRPSHIGWAYVGAIVGLACLLAGMNLVSTQVFRSRR